MFELAFESFGNLLAQGTIEDPGDLLARLDSGQLFCIATVSIALTGAFFIVSVIAITKTISSIFVSRSNARLIESMVDRGISPGEIQQLLQANSRSLLPWSSHASLAAVTAQAAAHRAAHAVNVPPAKPIVH